MRIAIKCPHCGERRIDTVCSPWFVQGFILIVRYGKRTYVGCETCVRRRVLENLGMTFVLGWWGIPHGVVMTPFVLFQNAVVALFPGGPDAQKRRLTALLGDMGIVLADVELGDDGLTVSQRSTIKRLANVLRSAIDADRVVAAEELAYASRIIRSVSGGVVSEDAARLMLHQQSTDLLDSVTDEEERVMLLEAAIAVVGADGTLTDTERRFIHMLGRRLSLPSGFVDRVMGRVLFGEEHVDEDEGDDVTLARIALGVGRAATFADVKRRYKEEILQSHPDVATQNGITRGQAEELTKKLNWAYSILKRELVQSGAAAS